ncbi:MAG TPA: VOC family protein [Candidatus Limnocylindria bacterium]|nr:VOC family protein [Candidatus Limnocylindria bacterium]
MESETQKLIPLLIYEDIAAVQRFLVRAFGFEEGILQRDPEGRIAHGEVWADGRVIWLHRSTGEHGLTSPKRLAAVSSGLVVLVPDVDDHFRHARDAGAAIEREPADQPYGQREYSARDPEGGRWYFATRTGPLRSEAEMTRPSAP